LSDYRTTIQFLYDLQRFGIKAGLENTRALLSSLGNPEKRLRCIHIAGTNGKGSTAAMIASVLTASGYRTGLYTSPHLNDFSERMRIDGEPISQHTVVSLIQRLQPIIRRRKATFFEATTAMAFQWFADQSVDIAVVETGLGGRWDATNVVTPLLSIITNIGLDHTEYLGRTYSRIAFEKGGIIKPGVPCITGTTNAAALATLQQVAVKKSAPLYSVQEMSSCTIQHRSLAGLQVDIRTRKNLFEDLNIGLAGDHQAANARLAVMGLEELRDMGLRRISTESIRNGFRAVRENTSLRGRMETLASRPLVIVDVAHNPDGISTLVHSLQSLVVGRPVVVFGVMQDKDYRSMIKALGAIARLVIAVRPNTDRASRSSDVVREFHSFGKRALDGRSVVEGVERAIKEVRQREYILVTGSHYVVGEVLQSCVFDH